MNNTIDKKRILAAVTILQDIVKKEVKKEKQNRAFYMLTAILQEVTEK
jgi:hypothetical protein